VNVAARDGTTPIYIAAREGRLETVRALLAAGAAPTSAPGFGRITAIDIAHLRNHVEVAQTLRARVGDEE